MRASPAPRPVGDPSRGGRPGEDPSPGFVVELFGLPGVGKSRLAMELVRAATDRDVPLERLSTRIDPEIATGPRIVRKLGLAAAECARRPARSGAAARAIVRSQEAGAAAGIRRWLHWVVSQRLVSSARATPGAHLVDEGVLQALWSVGLRGDMEAALGRVAEAPGRWALPDLIVVVRAPIEVIDGRLSGRASRHSRVQREADAQARRSELARGLILADRILEWWGGLFGGDRPVIHVENGEGASLERAASDAIPGIARHIAGLSGGTR